MVATMAALITREELGPDPDILSKFSAVAVARTACIEDNRARENARENIRKKLAMEAGKEKQDSCDLQVAKTSSQILTELSQICFMNEIASDDELELGENVDAATTAEDLLRANISQKVIIPHPPPHQHQNNYTSAGWSDNSADGGQEGEAGKDATGGGRRGAGGGEAAHKGGGFSEAGQYFQPFWCWWRFLGTIKV